LEKEVKIFKKMKDGGQESTVTGYWLIECKWLFSIVLLKFEGKSREMFHSHAFNCINWLFSGKLKETLLDGRVREYQPSFLPFKITREDFHKVDSIGTSWLLSFRGSWDKNWNEFDPKSSKLKTLTEGRIILSERKA
jgi:hypothetical protein